MKKQILKRAACVVILTGIVIGAIYGWKYYENEQRKKQSAVGKGHGFLSDLWF